MIDTVHQGAAADWDRYWQGSRESAAYTDGGVNHPAIASYWATLFASLRKDGEAYRLLDIASGAGAVLDSAIGVLGPALTSVSCIDISQSAIEQIAAQYPEVSGLVADARSIPLESASFDIVTSQFGVEYAGLDAVTEAARLVAEGGLLALLMHTRDGVIHAECAANRDATQAVLDSKFVPLAERFFEAGFAAVGGASRENYESAGKALAPAIAEVETILGKYGEDVAGGTLVKLYADVGSIHQSLPKYDAKEVLAWIATMQTELQAYVGRMRSMTDAAIDKAALDSLADSLRDAGLDVLVADALYPQAGSESLGWLLTARRQADG